MRRCNIKYSPFHSYSHEPHTKTHPCVFATLVYFLMLLVAPVVLTSCSKNSADEATVPQQVETTQTQQMPAPVATQDTSENMALPPTLNLNLSDSLLETTHAQEPSISISAPNAKLNRQRPVKNAAEKISISGGVLTDPEAEKMHKCIDGGKVKLELKWD